VTPNDDIKTMVFKAGAAAPPCIVLMNGDRTVCAKKLAALVGVGVIQVKPADRHTAERHTGYHFGGTYFQNSAL
jgi:prolyl-tRNA editing enzyme YbaK/EbsC (Cys-tRNA(Pro) deacylase)